MKWLKKSKRDKLFEEMNNIIINNDGDFLGLLKKERELLDISKKDLKRDYIVSYVMSTSSLCLIGIGLVRQDLFIVFMGVLSLVSVIAIAKNIYELMKIVYTQDGKNEIMSLDVEKRKSK